MMRRVAVVGDQLSTGGQIDHYEGPLCAWGDGGHQVALIGGSAYCETCKSTGVIAKAGGPRRINFMGETEADGDIVLCNCETPPRIVAKLAGESWCDDEDYSAVARATSGPQSFAGQRATCDEQYTLMDSQRRPLAGVRYRVRVGSNIVASGVTDSQGITQRIATDAAKRLVLEIAGGH
jgi:hypothetical protein